jgi:hypothetical protein
MATRRRLFARGACRSLLWGLAFFALLQGGLSLALEQWWISARDPAFGPKIARLRERAHRSPDARLVVMIGSSRTGAGLRPGPFEEDLGRQLGQPLVIFNLGIPAGGPHSHLLQLRRTLREGIRPDLLLVEILPALLDDRHLGPPHLAIAERLSWRDLQEVRHHPVHAHALRVAWREARVVPWYTHRFSLLSMILPTALPVRLRQDAHFRCDDCGCVDEALVPLTPEQRRAAAEFNIQGYRHTLETFQLGPSCCAALRLLLDECRRHHIQVALVLMPEGPIFRSIYTERVWQQLGPFLDRLSRECSAPLINARCWLDEDSFLDSHHLSPDGAACFTQRLGREVIVPLLRHPVP